MPRGTIATEIVYSMGLHFPSYCRIEQIAICIVVVRDFSAADMPVMTFLIETELLRQCKIP